jgi:tripartite-type tricarboxylate transporter receptor subunit TctC
MQLVAGAAGVSRFAKAHLTRTVTLIVPFAAGGATDVATRIHCRART